MKRCLQCNRTYPDDSLKFCLSDGTKLAPVFDALEDETVVRAMPFVQHPAQPARQGVSPMFAYLAVGVLALLIGGAVVMWIRFDSNDATSNKSEVPITTSDSFEPKPNYEQENINTQKTNLQEEQALLEKEKQKLADERKNSEILKNKSVESTTVTSFAPPTARIKFRRGSAQETISGNVNSKRDFVLRAKSGQYLSATINSGNGCVVFGNNSINTTYTTSSGDNYLNLVNNCGGETSFSLTVYIR